MATEKPITNLKLKLVGEDGNAFNGKTLVMESFGLRADTLGILVPHRFP